MAESIEDQTLANGALEIISIINPLWLTPGDIGEDGIYAVCKAVVGNSVGGGIELTSKALQLAVAMGNTETGSVQRMIESRRKFGYDRLAKARELLRWKRDNCPCQDDPPPPDNDPSPSPDQPSGGSVTTSSGSSGSGSGSSSSSGGPSSGGETTASGPTVFEGGGMTVTVLDNGRVQVDLACEADDKRVQMRTTGTWSTKSMGQDSTVIEGLRVGATYELRSRCDRLLRESLQFTMPDGR